ncbi:hypothetical protein [Actinoplanes sp. NPDC020271]|uniref:hypothetical protein n=1 Tax=Actinoplanes sp. NPDC020271 TaxID=3363896 RepID=UPI0037B6FF3A
MTVAHQSDVNLDLGSALYTATSLQTTIRHADVKAQSMLGLLGGSVVIVLQQVPALERCGSTSLLAATAVAAVAWLAALTIGAWHLLAAVSPRLSPASRANRFTLPTKRPATISAREQRNEAWDLVSVLAGIAVAKHSRVGRASPAVAVAAMAAGTLTALTTIAAIAM